MKEIDTLLWDLDATLIDFKKSCKISIINCCKRQNVFPTEEQLNEYFKINELLWGGFEKGLNTIDDIYARRFPMWAEKFNFPLDCSSFDSEYQQEMGKNPIVFDEAIKTLSELKKRGFRQFIVTNGTVKQQNSKLKYSGIDKLVDGAFISEETGFHKPEKEFFNYCASKIPDYDNKKTAIIGDSLSSDMMGGNNAGIICIWFNNKSNTDKQNRYQKQVLNFSDKSVSVDYEIKNLEELIDLFN